MGPGVMALFGSIFFSLVRICVLLRNVRQRWLTKDEIRFSLYSPHPNGATGVVRGSVEVCLRWTLQDLVGVGIRWIHLDLVFAHLCSCVYRLDPFDVRFSLSMTVVVLVRWTPGALVR